MDIAGCRLRLFNRPTSIIWDQLDDSKSIYYGYDPNDRLTLTSWVTGTTLSAETYSYTSGTNRLASLTDSSGTRSISYDGRGNTSAETRPGSVAVSTSYDGYGRLLAYSRTGDPAQTNVYNGLDDRVSVTSGSTTHLVVYDPDGRQLGEYGTSASDVIAETIWLQPRGCRQQPHGRADGYQDATGAAATPPASTMPGFPGQAHAYRLESP